MAHAMKHTKATCGHMFKHYERAQDENGEYIKFGNQDIDTAFSGSNYSLAPSREISQGDFVRQRCSEVRMQNRKDINVMCSWVVTAPQTLPNDEIRRFFGSTYEFLSDRYGKENVVSAYVHMDETTPHMHYAFVPVVEDKKRGGYKVSAKEAIDRKDLQTFHKDYDAHITKVFGRDIGVLNEATKEGNKSIEELKKSTAQVELRDISHKAATARVEASKLQNDILTLETRREALQGKIEGLGSELEGKSLTLKKIEAIKPEKSFAGAVKNISLEQIENIKATAIKYHETKAENEVLKKENAKLKGEVNSWKVANKKTEKERIAEYRRIQQLEAKAKAFEKLPEDMQKELLQPEKRWDKGLSQER